MLSTFELVQRIFAQPTAPFREQFVLQECQAIAKAAGLPFVQDRFGNLIVGVKSLKDLSSGRRLLLFAHMDHPGFLVQSQPKDKRLAEGVWFGGGPFGQMKNAKVRLYHPETSQVLATGLISEFESGPYKVEGLKLKIKMNTAKDLPPGTFGAFAQPALKLKGDQIITRVADDLAGCVMALGAAMDATKKGRVIAVLTRAEEVGLVGCLALLKKHKISDDSLCVSLEASKELPGAQLGHGPVLRLGDRATLFDNLACQFMWTVAQDLQKGRGFKYQRRIMDGGRCEASAMSAYGLRTTGLAVPLRNYHNQGRKGPAPEIIHAQDLENGRTLLAQMGELLPEFPGLQARLKKSMDAAFHALVPHLERPRSWKNGDMR